MRLLTGINDLLAFALELIMLAVLGWWGFTRGGGLVASVALGLGAPLAAGLAWAAFAAPRAWIPLPVAGVLTVKVLVFAGASLALASRGHRTWAVTFAAVVIVNLIVALTAKP